MKIVKHVSIRIYLHLLLTLSFLTGGLALILLAPLYKNAFAPYAAYKELSFFPIWVHMYRMIWRTLTDKKYRDMFDAKLTDPPMLGNNLKNVRIRDSWPGAKDNCDGCQLSCCAQIKCPLLYNGRCLAFGSFFFGYMNCGRHPENQAQIDRYNCPKWEVTNA